MTRDYRPALQRIPHPGLTHEQRVELRKLCKSIDPTQWRDAIAADFADIELRMLGLTDEERARVIQAIGIHGALLGARLDWVVADDLLDHENTRTKAQRDDVFDWFHATVMGRLTRNAKVIVLGRKLASTSVLSLHDALAQVTSNGSQPYRDLMAAIDWEVLGRSSGKPCAPQRLRAEPGSGKTFAVLDECAFAGIELDPARLRRRLVERAGFEPDLDTRPRLRTVSGCLTLPTLPKDST